MGRPRKEDTPNIIWKGNREFRHDLFKLELERMKKNMSFRSNQIDIQEVEHCHFYHSVSNKGTANQYSSPVGGHFHEVFTSTDANGNIIAKCGPALQKVTIKIRTGKFIKRIIPVEYSYVDDIDGRDKILKDEHLHNISYIGSEIISSQRIKAQHQSDRDQLQKLQPNFDTAFKNEEHNIAESEASEE